MTLTLEARESSERARPSSLARPAGGWIGPRNGLCVSQSARRSPVLDGRVLQEAETISGEEPKAIVDRPERREARAQWRPWMSPRVWPEGFCTVAQHLMLKNRKPRRDAIDFGLTSVATRSGVDPWSGTCLGNGDRNPAECTLGTWLPWQRTLRTWLLRKRNPATRPSPERTEATRSGLRCPADSHTTLDGCSTSGVRDSIYAHSSPLEEAPPLDESSLVRLVTRLFSRYSFSISMV